MKARVKTLLARTRVSRIWKSGQTLTEYGLIMVVISFVAIAVYGLINTQISRIFSGIDNIIDTAQSSH